MKTSVVFLALAGLVLPFMAACGSATVGQPAPGVPTSTATPMPGLSTTSSPVEPYGTFRVGNPDFNNEGFDPNLPGGAVWGWAIYDPLITWDAGGNYAGAVAEKWSIAEDGNTWTFILRDDIVFHDGTPLTARDVKFSVDRFASEDSANPWSQYLRANVHDTQVVDDHTFVYRTNTPEPTLIAAFAWTRILPVDYFNRVGEEEFRNHPIGSGPWKFVDLVPETSMTLEAFTGHWRQVPAYRYVVELQVPEEATRLAMLKIGDIDIAMSLSTDRTAELIREGWRAEYLGLPVLFNISFPGTWVTAGPTSDKRVRQAMSYAINRQELCDTLLAGMAQPGGRWFMHEGAWGWDPSWAADPYDPDLARALLAEAGYPNAFPTPTIRYATIAAWAELGEALQSYWSEVGLDVKIEIVEATRWFADFTTRSEDVDGPNVGSVVPWNNGSVFDSIYHSANMYTSTGVHGTANDPEADRLYREVITTVDDTLRKQRWTGFQNYVKEMWINVGVVMIEKPLVFGPNVGALTIDSHKSLIEAYAGLQHPE